jgi:hypothetical protein
MKKMNGCVVKNGVIELTKAFAKLAYTPGTEEFRYLAELHKAFPDFKITMRTANPKKDKEKHTDLTIARMEFIIKNYVGSEKALAEFEEVKKFYKGTKGYYGKVKGWFLNKYPKYKEIDFEAMAAEANAEALANEETNDLRIAG